MTLTLRDHDLLVALTRKVRMLSVRHVASVWWPTTRSTETAHRRLRRLEEARLLELHRINAHPPLREAEPLFTWKPGGEDPDSRCVSEHARHRWNLPAQPTDVCVASPLAASLFGSTARGLPPQEHRDHDLRLGDVFVRYRNHAPQLAAFWIGEHALPKAGYRIKDPDAFLRDEQGRILQVIESAGRYSSAQVESFHEHCAELSLPYELW